MLIQNVLMAQRVRSIRNMPLASPFGSLGLPGLRFTSSTPAIFIVLQ